MAFVSPKLLFITNIVILFLIFNKSNAEIVNKDILKEELNQKQDVNQNMLIKKCCKDGEYIIKQKLCRKRADSHEGLDYSHFDIYNTKLEKIGKSLKGVEMESGVFNKSKAFKRSVLDYVTEDHREYNFYLTESHGLIVEMTTNDHRWYVLDKDHFCVEYSLKKGKPEPRYFINFKVSQNSNNLQQFVTYGFIISSVFLALVLLVYSLLPELRNICGLLLMGYVASLLGAFILLFTLRIDGRLSNNYNVCLTMTPFIYYFMLASSCWTNVMSLDIWWTFRGYAKARSIHRRGERFKFLVYCAYAWGLPLILTIILVALRHIKHTHSARFIPPNYGTSNDCFLDGPPKMFYLYVPMLILLSCNLVFYVMAVFNIWRVHHSTKILDSFVPVAQREQKIRFLIYFKLSILMGINWVLEVACYKLPNFRVLHYVADSLNVLIGVIIFVIFICKRRVFMKLTKRLSSSTQSQGSNSMQHHSSESSMLSANFKIGPVCLDPEGPKRE